VAARVRWIDSTGGGEARGAVDRGTWAVSWFSTPEARATIIVGIVTVVVQPIFLYAAFQFGKAQARAQVRHQKAVEAIVSALRIIEQLQSQFGMWAIFKKRDKLEIEYAKEISRLRDELRELVYDNSPWF
jgi:hypothetical protein